MKKENICVISPIIIFISISITHVGEFEIIFYTTGGQGNSTNWDIF